MDSFSALMTELEDGSNSVVISVFENIIVDAAKTTKDETKRSDLIKVSIKNAVDLIGKTAARLPESKFCVVMPLKRPAVKWYQDNLQAIENNIRQAISAISVNNVTRVNCVCHSLQQFEPDEIHLTKDSGAIFVEAILKASEEVFEAIQVEEEQDGGVQDIGGLVSVLKTRFEADNLMFARMREEIDSTANRSREDRVVITGITCKTPLPRDNRQRIEKLKELATEVFEAVKRGFQ
jgi:hypothetical protein